MKHLVTGLLIALLCFCWGQEPSYQIVTSAEQISQQIALATEELLLATDLLRSEVIAEALREALVVRGVAVYLLIPETHAEENASYVASLAYTGANVRLSEIGGSFLVIDRRITIAGELIGSLNTEASQTPTILVDDETYAAQFIGGFIQGFETATPYIPIGE